MSRQLYDVTLTQMRSVDIVAVKPFFFAKKPSELVWMEMCRLYDEKCGDPRRRTC